MINSPMYVHLRPGGPLPDAIRMPPFRAVVIVESPVPADWRCRVSEWLVSSGCLYMMAWGIDCSGWDDSVDIANIEAFDYGDIPEERFVYTTWHDHESLPEVFDFSKRHAVHPAAELAATVLLHVAERADAANMLRSYAEA